MKHYILEGKVPKPVDDIIEWAKSMENNNRVVKQENIGDILISTVFLGIDHSYSFSDPDSQPILFETMIFGGDLDNYQERYSTYEQAEKGHRKAIELVKSKLN